MIKKITLTILLLLFLNNCGYQPIYSSKNVKFAVGELTTIGDKKVNKLLIKKLEIYNNDDDLSKIIYNLNITSESTKDISSKDTKGNPATFTLTVLVNLEIKNSLGEKNSQSFKQYTTYNNNNNKFDLRKYEDSIKENMTENINEDIIQYLQNLN